MSRRHVEAVQPATRLAFVVNDQQPTAIRRGNPLGRGAGTLRHRLTKAQRWFRMQWQAAGLDERQRAVAPIATDEVRHEVVCGTAQNLGRRGELGEPTTDGEDGDPFAELDCLVDVMGDEHDCLTEIGLQTDELVLQLGPHHGVDGRERLVHQHHRGVGRQRPGDADPLLLTTGQLRGIAAAHRGIQPDPRE